MTEMLFQAKIKFHPPSSTLQENAGILLTSEREGEHVDTQVAASFANTPTLS